MKTSDIPTRPILEFLKQRGRREGTVYLGFDNSVANAMPEGVNQKLAMSKMSRLINQGLVSGCACGCHGHFALTEKGDMELGLA